MAEQKTLPERLLEIAMSRELADGQGIYIFDKSRGLYLSGSPYLWSSDANRAFIFRDRKQAQELILAFVDELPELEEASVRAFYRNGEDSD